MKQKGLIWGIIILIAGTTAIGASLNRSAKTTVLEASSQVPVVSGPVVPESDAVSTADTEVPQSASPALQAAEAMRVGWNLGNALESIGTAGNGWNHRKYGVIRGYTPSADAPTPEDYYEQYWRNPVTTRAMIDAVAQAGFGAIRIPVSWYDHMNQFDVNGDGVDDLDQFFVRQQWLERVEEVVGYVLDNNLYCIINIHHDDNWLRAYTGNEAAQEACEERLAALWRIIATHFKDHSDRLIFESFNEVKVFGENGADWSGTSAGFEAINRLNQVFVDTVRATGGGNSSRILIVKPYAAGTSDAILQGFRMPNDTAENSLIVSVHLYEPSRFTWTESMWPRDDDNTDQFDDTAKSELDRYLSRIAQELTDQEIPVIIGEYGAWNKQNDAARAEYASYLVGQARQYGISCFWWDTGLLFDSPDEVKGSTLFDRGTCTQFFPEIIKAIIDAAA